MMRGGFNLMDPQKANPDPAPAVVHGDAQPTLQGIALRSGLSLTTISRVLRGQASENLILGDSFTETGDKTTS